MCVRSQGSAADADPALSEPEGNSEHSGSSDSLWEASLENVSGTTDAPAAPSVAIQVSLKEKRILFLQKVVVGVIVVVNTFPPVNTNACESITSVCVVRRTFG